MIGGIIGWLLGVALSLFIVTAIPGEQGIWAFFIGFACGFVGFLLGSAIQESRE